MTQEEKAAAYKQKLKEQAEKRKKRKRKIEEDATSSEEEVEEMKEAADDDSKKAKTYADMLEEEEIKKEAEVKREENRIKRENIWKKRTVSFHLCTLYNVQLYNPPPDIKIMTFFRWMPSLKRRWLHTGGEEHRGNPVGEDKTVSWVWMKILWRLLLETG